MNKRTGILLILLLLTVGLFAFIKSPSNTKDSNNQQTIKMTHTEYNIDISGKINAPDFSGGVGWLNVERPLTLQELRGKVVLLDFWTFCCINCIHVIPDLKKLEAKYPDRLVVVGVHSAKFENEQETENIRAAVLRYEIEHPVVNDANFVIWRKYGARAWPTFAVIDPEGKIVGTFSGEGNYEVLDYIIKKLIEKFNGQLDTSPIPIALEKNKRPPSVLAFPGKLYVDESSGRLFIADTNHNRIVITDMDGAVLDIAGNGNIGFKDGSFGNAEFNHPQGMVLDGEWLYVADTENHALRRLDLIDQTVTTVAGTGKQSRVRNGGPALSTPLNSPWDVTRIGGRKIIYIAMAGYHQLWTYNPENQEVKIFAGSGREDIIDGNLKTSALAQPSGIISDGTNLYFADSEVSALRWVDLSKKPGKVKTFIGTGLFDFGDKDGAFKSAQLQHPLGVAYQNGYVYVADAYNHKIKAADISNQTITTIAGNGEAGVGSVKHPQFNEPGGISIAGDYLYIADTNNHAIRVMNIKTKEVSTLNIDITDWEIKKSEQKFHVFGSPAILDPEKIYDRGKVYLTFHLPKKYHLNPLALPLVQIRVTGNKGDSWIGERFKPEVNGNTIYFPIETGTINSPKSIEIAVTYYYCRTNNQGQCRIGSVLINSPLVSGTQVVKLEYSVQ